MFVFYYCWRRGRESRLAREAETGKDGSSDDRSAEVSSEESDDEVDEAKPAAVQQDSAEAVASKVRQDIAGSANKDKEDVLDQSQPSEVPLPDSQKGEKGEKDADL